MNPVFLALTAMVFGGLSLGLGACGGKPPTLAGRVLFLTLDTTRWDYLALSGNPLRYAPGVRKRGTVSGHAEPTRKSLFCLERVMWQSIGSYQVAELSTAISLQIWSQFSP